MSDHGEKSNLNLTNILAISSSKASLWFVITLASFSMAFLFPVLSSPGYLGALFYSTNLSATILLHGIPFSLGAALFFTTEKSQQRISQAISRGYRPVVVYGLRLIAFFLISLGLFTGLLCISFVLAAQVVPNIDFIITLRDFPAALESALVIIWIVTSICAFTTLLIDDWRGAILFNTAVCVIPGFYFGPTPQTPGIHGEKSLYSFYHMFRFLAVLLSRHDFATDDQMRYVMALAVGIHDLMIPLAVLLAISILATGGAVWATRENIKRWRLESAEVAKESKDAEESKESKEEKIAHSLNRFRKHLQQRRQAAVAGLVLLWIVIPLAGMYTIPAQSNGSEEVVYSSPAEGIIIELEEWLYGQVEIPKPPGGKDNFVQTHVTIINWGDCPEPLSAKVGMLPCTEEYFADLSYENKYNAISGVSRNIDKEISETGLGMSNFGSVHGNFTWAVMFFDENSNSTEGTLTVQIEVSYKQT